MVILILLKRILSSLRMPSPGYSLLLSPPESLVRYFDSNSIQLLHHGSLLHPPDTMETQPTPQYPSAIGMGLEEEALPSQGSIEEGIRDGHAGHTPLSSVKTGNGKGGPIDFGFGEVGGDALLCWMRAGRDHGGGLEQGLEKKELEEEVKLLEELVEELVPGSELIDWLRENGKDLLVACQKLSLRWTLSEIQGNQTKEKEKEEIDQELELRGIYFVTGLLQRGTADEANAELVFGKGPMAQCVSVFSTKSITQGQPIIIAKN